MAGLLIFDCDSTLSTIEGVDELARIKGPDVYEAVERMTTEAMEGKIPVEEIFRRRLDLIQPSSADVAAVGKMYCETVVPGVVSTLGELMGEAGWQVVILSGGFRQAIRPLAEFLGVNRVEAVDLYFGEKGTYQGFAEDYPTTRSGGKPEVVRKLRQEWEQCPSPWVMIGDGVSDLETRGEVDAFIGFGGVVSRPKVEAGADRFLTDFSQIPAALKALFPEA